MSSWDFDVILGMNWLSKYHVTVNHFTKEVVLKFLDYKKSDIHLILFGVECYIKYELVNQILSYSEQLYQGNNFWIVGTSESSILWWMTSSAELYSNHIDGIYMIRDEW